MSSDVIATWVSAIATLGSAVAAVMAWKAARSSSDAAARLTALEASRRHDELTPRLILDLEPVNPGDLQHYYLWIRLEGPLALVRLDSMTIKVRDDRPGRDEIPSLGAAVTSEAVRAQVWGPLRFSPNLGPAWAKADGTGRSITVTRALAVGERLVFQMEPTLPPPWYRDRTSGSDDWRRDAGALLRLSVAVGSSAVNESWELPVELDLAAKDVEGFD